MGTGGGNVPMVIEVYEDSDRDKETGCDCSGPVQPHSNRRCDDDTVLREDGSASYAMRGGGK